MARTRNTFTISSFGGLDTASPLLQVNAARSIDSLNMIRLNDKSVQSRKPWEQIAESPALTYHKKQKVNGVETWVSFTNPTDFNGMWEFVGEDGVSHVVAHIGYTMFEIKGLGKGKTFKDVSFVPLITQEVVGSNTYNIIVEMLNEKTKAVSSGNRLYIMGGIKYLMLRFTTAGYELVEVENSDYVYIPTTMIGKTYKDSPITGGTQLDDVNLLSSYRKNKLLTGTLYEGNNIIRTTRFYETELDSDMDSYDDSFELTLEYKGDEA